MRTTLDIDDAVLEAAEALARGTRRTTGAVLSELARRALMGSAEAETESVTTPGVGGVVSFERGGDVVTNDLIDKLGELDAY